MAIKRISGVDADWTYLACDKLHDHIDELYEAICDSEKETVDKIVRGIRVKLSRIKSKVEEKIV